MRFGISVSQKFDNGCDDWLLMNGNPEEWAVAFHGVRYPNNSSGEVKVLNQIMEGLKQKEMLRAGGGQAHRSDEAVNMPGV